MRCLVAGCGSIGRRHIANVLTLGVDEVVAFDVCPQARKLADEEFGVTTVSTIERALSYQPSVALIATPANTHVPLAKLAALHGCHLFVEKPLSHRLDGIAELLAMAEERRLVTMVACNMRFHPGPAAVKRLLSENAIGEVLAARLETGSYLPRWRPWQDYRRSYSASTEWGGAILDCIHEIDLALWYFGPARVEAAAQLPARTLELKTDGLAELLLTHTSGVLSSIHLNFVQRDYHRTCQVIGSKGTIYWSFADGTVKQFNDKGELANTVAEPEGWELDQMYVDELAHYLSCVRSGHPSTNPLASGMEALQVALAARQTGGVPQS